MQVERKDGGSALCTRRRPRSMRSMLRLMCLVAPMPCAAYQKLPPLLAPSAANCINHFARRLHPSGSVFAGAGVATRMMAESPKPPAGFVFDEEDAPEPPRPRVNWSDRFKKALDMNPGRYFSRASCPSRCCRAARCCCASLMSCRKREYVLCSISELLFPSALST